MSTATLLATGLPSASLHTGSARSRPCCKAASFPLRASPQARLQAQAAYFDTGAAAWLAASRAAPRSQLLRRSAHSQDSATLQKPAAPQHTLPHRDLQPHQVRQLPRETAEEPTPILAGGGGGIFFFWQLGVLRYLEENFDLNRMQMVGASAGALSATLAACNVDAQLAVDSAYDLAKEIRIWDRPLGLAGVWGGLVVQWLDQLLPPDAVERCRGRLKLVLTEVPSFQQVYVHDYSSRADLLSACMASVHVPFFLDGRPATRFRGRLYLDGSLSDFITWDNSELLKCGGRAFVLDYSQDTQLQAARLDFLRLRSYDEVLALIEKGYAYGQRVDKAGGFDRLYGRLRRRATDLRPLRAPHHAPARSAGAAAA